MAEAKRAHTAAYYLLTARLWFKWLVEHGRLPSNPASDVNTAKLPPRRRRTFLLPNQARRLPGACVNLDLKFALYCGLHAGLRKNDIVEAWPECLDLEVGLLHVQTTATLVSKDRDNRMFPLPAAFRAYFNASFFFVWVLYHRRFLLVVASSHKLTDMLTFAHPGTFTHLVHRPA